MTNPILPLDTCLPDLLRSGKRLRGVFNGLPSPAIVEMCAFAGFDFLVIDNEHGNASLEATEHMLRAARASGLPTLVRCLEHDIARTLDLGVGGLQIPMVDTAQHAAALVQRVKYPSPAGSGGVSGRRGSAFSSRAAGYGAFGGPEHTRRSNDGIALVVMIETPEGVANAAAIAAVDGVDAVFIGPNATPSSCSGSCQASASTVGGGIRCHRWCSNTARGSCEGVALPRNCSQYQTMAAAVRPGPYERPV